MRVQFDIVVYTDHLKIPGPREIWKRKWVEMFAKKPGQDDLAKAVRARLPKLKTVICEAGLVWDGSVNIGTFRLKPGNGSSSPNQLGDEHATR